MWTILRCARYNIATRLAFDVVSELLQVFDHQGYSPAPFLESQEVQYHRYITLHTNRSAILKAVQDLKSALSRTNVPRGTGYYLCENDVYVCWHDSSCVCVNVQWAPRTQSWDSQKGWTLEIQLGRTKVEKFLTLY